MPNKLSQLFTIQLYTLIGGGESSGMRNYEKIVS